MGPVVGRSGPRPLARDSPSPVPDVRRLRVEAGLGLGVAGLAVPGGIPSLAAFGGIERDGPGVLAPALRLGVLRAASTTLPSPGGGARFTWLVGRVEACPIRVSFLRRLAARPCLGFDGGALSGDGLGATRSHSVTRPWLDAGAAGRLEWSVAEPIRVEAEGSLGLPFVRDTFVFQPTPEVYRPPPVYGSAGLGVVALFP